MFGWQKKDISRDNSFILRNYPDDDALKNPDKYSKALSFSPDIIPLYGTKADQSALVDDASWRGFTGMPIVGGHVNNVYVRGYGSGGPHVAYLRAIPSELILWPQIWSDVKPVSSGPVVISAGNTQGRYASDGPLQFRPPHSTGHTYSLVAHVVKHDSAKEDEPVLPLHSEHFGANEFLNFLSQDNGFTFYNVIVADPTLKHVSATLDSACFTKLHKGTRAPDGLQVSLVDDRGDISVPRTPLTTFGERKFTLKPSYDGILTLNIFSPPGQVLFEPYSGLSLQVFKSGSFLQAQLLGALNVLFEHHSTRNIRFASPASSQLGNYESGSRGNPRGFNSLVLAPAECGPIPVTTPAATGWWFRESVNDTNNFPLLGPTGYSPDIQPVGTELPNQSVWDSLQNPSADYSTANAIELVGGENNYVVVRGHSTMTDIDFQTRIFALNPSILIDPVQFPTKSIPGRVASGIGTVATQSISTANSNQFYPFNIPFVVQAPSDSLNHYCFVAEVRQKHKCCLVYSSWPGDQEEQFATAADFINWVLGCPWVCQRNINWIPGGNSIQSDGKSWTWSCTTQLAIPQYFSFCTFWTVIVECDNPIIPAGSTWTLKCKDDKIFPKGICFENLPINTNSPAFAGCHFTGAPPGYSTELTISVTWYDESTKIPPPRVKFRIATTDAVTKLSPIKHMAVSPPAGSASWPLIVTGDYPYLGKEIHPSPLPSFEAAGTYVWPFHPDVPNFVFGQVSFAVKAK